LLSFVRVGLILFVYLLIFMFGFYILMVFFLAYYLLPFFSVFVMIQHVAHLISLP